MRNILAAIAIAAFGIAPASAADFPPFATKAAPLAASPIYDWTGLYLGINGGGGRSNNCWDLNGAFIVGFTPALSEGCNAGTGAVVGAQVGYRHQVNNFVFGIEAQGDWANLKGSNRSAVFDGINANPILVRNGVSIDLTNTSKVNAIGTFTGQIGYAFGSVLWYVKGGAAVTDNTHTGSLSISGPAAIVGGIPSPLLTDTAHETKFGGVVGTGAEFMFAPGWSVGAEYNHLFMGSRDIGLNLTNAPFAAVGGIGLLGAGSPSRNDRISQDIDMATIRINYKFGAR